MFAFKHDATDQTPQQIDYRYIGNDPYNYVYFNCDELQEGVEYNYAESCEVWRIIGVFDVEREIDDEENPGEKKTITEQRIKLVRGNTFETDMKWDSSQKNDWTNASLQLFLNNSYLNRTDDASSYGLKPSANSMIDEAKYYLGSISSDYNDTARYGSTEKIYGEERGNVVCIACNNNIDKLTWTGKVSLMYPSDEYMTYAKGVDEVCYNDPSSCSPKDSNGNSRENPGYPGKSWVYNSNHKASWFLIDYVVLISPSVANRYNSCIILNNGVFSGGGITSVEYSVRPVVYLSSSVQIFDGDGSEGNPYKLKK